MKYRVWDKINKKYFKQGEWETYIWVDHEGKPFEMNITVHGSWLSPRDISDQYEIEYESGLVDREFKTIYINDIIRSCDDLVEAKITVPQLFKSGKDWDIIGNKHENEELWVSL
jgi:hypothetical protein